MLKNKKQKIKDSRYEVGEFNPISHSEVKKRWMKNPEFKKAYDALEPEYAIVRAMIQMRLKNKMSQKDLAKKLGTKQPAIARFESGAYNPTISFLKKLSTALGGKLEIKI